MKKYVKLYEEFINEYSNLEVKESYQRTSKINTVEKFIKASKLKVGKASIKDLLQFIYDNFEDITGEKYQEPWDFIGNDFIADIISTYKYGEEVVDQWKSMFEGNLFEARGFTMKEVRDKAIEMFKNMGIKFPSEEQIKDGIENIKALITKHQLGTILESVNEGKFNYMKDSDEVRDLFRKITGESGHDVLDSNMFDGGGSGYDDDGEGWMLNIDDTNIPAKDKAKFVDAVMKLGKKKGWKIKQYGNDSVEIYESLNEANAPLKDLEKNMPDHVEGWAKYVAQHANGEWWYYEDYPVLVKNVGWRSHDRDGYQMGSDIKTNARGWEKSVQKLKESVNEGKFREFELEIINKNGKRSVQRVHANPETTELFDIIANLKKSPNVKDVEIKESINEAEKPLYKKGQKVQYQLDYKGGVGKYADSVSKSQNVETNVILKRKKKLSSYEYILTNGITVHQSEIIGLAESHVKMYEDFAVYEAEAVQGKQPVNIMVGRFQPFHNGHYLACKELHEANGNPVVLVTVRGSGKSGKGTAFTEATMDKMMKDVIKKSGFIIDHVEIKFVAFDTQLFPALRPKYEPVLMGAGDDRVDTYERQTQSMRVKHENKLNIREDFAIHLTGRYGSGTAVRQSITDRDQKEFENTMPKFLHGYWDILSKEMGMNEGKAYEAMAPLFPDVLKIKKDIKITSNTNNERDVLPAGEYKSTGKEFDGMHIYQSKGKNWFLWPEDMDIINDMNEGKMELNTTIPTSTKDYTWVYQTGKESAKTAIEINKLLNDLGIKSFISKTTDDTIAIPTKDLKKAFTEVLSKYDNIKQFAYTDGTKLDKDVVNETNEGKTYRVYLDGDYEEHYTEDPFATKEKAIAQAKRMAKNHSGKIEVTSDEDINDVVWTNESKETETIEDTKVEGPKEDTIDRIARTCDDCKKDLAKTGASIEKLKTAIENGAKDPKAFESLAQLVKIHENLIKELAILESNKK